MGDGVTEENKKFAMNPDRVAASGRPFTFPLLFYQSFWSATKFSLHVLRKIG